MRKPKHMARAIAIGTIALAIFVAIMFVLLFNNWLNGNVKGEDSLEVAKRYRDENFYENGWDKRIVPKIAEGEVPIPNGFELESGTKETGLIIKDQETGTELLWIPYDETAQVEGIEEYYSNVKYQTIDSETLDSIEKYGGFYITLEEQNQYEALKQVDNESYQNAIIAANQIYENSESVNSHLITRTELEQIINFANKNGTTLMQTSESEKNNYKLDKLITTGNTITKTAESNNKLGLISVHIESYTNVDENTEEKGKENVAQKVFVTVEGKEKIVYVPKGYNYMTLTRKTEKNSQNKEIVKIHNKYNTNLVYVWVPVDEEQSVASLEQAREELNKLYTEYDVKNNWKEAADPTDSEEYKELIASVKEYGGFYMAEAELGYDDRGIAYNKARGMSEVEETGYGLVTQGEYYRRTNVIKEGITEKSGLEKDEDGYHLNYEKAEEIARKMGEQTPSVVSHITYGAEWDAVMLWIMKTNKQTFNGAYSLDIIENIIKSSTYMPGCKYAGGIIDGARGGNLETSSINKINGLYGLAGNLCDTTQETMEEEGKTYHILRGGSYETAGNEFPMASRLRMESIDFEDIGFRNCLYIKPTEKVTTAEEGVIYKWSGNIAVNFEEGEGTQSNPYIVRTPEQLAYLAKTVNEGNTYEGKYIKITSNLNLDNKKWTPIAKIVLAAEKDGDTLPGTYYEFKGILDGGNHRIEEINVEEEYGAGLIGIISGAGQVKNIKIKSGKITAKGDWAGGIAGYMFDNAVIEGCTNEGEVTARENYAGGIAGVGGYNNIENEQFKITNCINSGKITAGESYAGGIIGYIKEQVREHIDKNTCTNTGEIIAPNYKGDFVGNE